MTRHLSRLPRVLALVAPLALAACSLGGGPSVDDAQAAARIARKIQADPARADEILAAEGTDRAAFEETLYDIAASPEASRAYAAAL